MNAEDNNDQLARIIYHRMLSTMKHTLDLEEQKYIEKGRQDDRYKFFKKQLMSNTYDNLRALFDDLAGINLIEPTEIHEDVKDGYRPTASGGSGYVNTQDFEAWLNNE